MKRFITGDGAFKFWPDTTFASCVVMVKMMIAFCCFLAVSLVSGKYLLVETEGDGGHGDNLNEAEGSGHDQLSGHDYNVPWLDRYLSGLRQPYKASLMDGT